MTIRLIHTADIHLGKTCRGSVAEEGRYDDVFRTPDAIVAGAGAS